MPRDDWKNLPRLYVRAALAGERRLAMPPDQAHYLTRVMRRAAGDRVLLFNGSDGEWLGTIEAIRKNALDILCLEQTRIQTHEPDLLLLFAPVKRDPMEYLLQKACELGVARLQPVITHRTIARQVNIDRLRMIAREAAEQSERLTLPEILPPTPLASALTQLDERPLFACLESGPSLPVAEAFTARQKSDSVALLTGPEGGFSAEEADLIRRHAQTIAVNLGPRILRADTAALAAIAVWQALRGDWQA